MITFAPASREGCWLLIGLAAPSGGGKTYSALRLATGIREVTGKPIAVIDTEARRSRHYADRFRFDVADLGPPFRPERYLEAIRAAEAAGYGVIVVDSFSHEYAGEGGLLDWHEEELARLGGEDPRRRKAVSLAAWVAPKTAHKRLMSALLQARAHVILCLRAEQKVEMVRGPDGEVSVQPKRLLSGFSDWIPVAEKNVLYDLTLSVLLTPDKPGIPQAIKVQEQHRALLPSDQPLSEKVGQALAAWAQGDPAPTAQPEPRAPASPPETPAQASLVSPDEERAILIGRIQGLADKKQVSPARRRDLWRAHCGEATLETADLALLHDLYRALQREPGPTLKKGVAS
jgi:hypothetical protein